jgi:hypothetical protein
MEFHFIKIQPELGVTEMLQGVKVGMFVIIGSLTLEKQLGLDCAPSEMVGFAHLWKYDLNLSVERGPLQ